MRPAPQARRGLTLVVVVVLLLALQVLAHGVLVSTLREMEAAQAGRFLVQARFAAEAAVGRWSRRLQLGGEELLPGEARTVGVDGVAGTTAQLVEERLTREGWLVEGAATVDGWAGQVRRGRLMWIMDPVARVAAAPGVVTTELTAPVVLAGAVGTNVLAPTDQDGPLCQGWSGQLAPTFPTGTLPAVAAGERRPPRPRLGLLSGAELVDLAPGVTTDSVTPAPTFHRGACAVDQPHNWGGRTDGRTACQAHHVLRARDGDLVVAGGVGQGVLVVTGDLILAHGASFRGMVLVGGHLTLRDSAALEGLAEASAGITVAPGASVAGSACAAVEALTAVRSALALPMPHPALTDAWVGPLPARR